MALAKGDEADGRAVATVTGAAGATGAFSGAGANAAAYATFALCAGMWSFQNRELGGGES